MNTIAAHGWKGCILNPLAYTTNAVSLTLHLKQKQAMISAFSLDHGLK
jgi:hypothetical protein